MDVCSDNPFLTNEEIEKYKKIEEKITKKTIEGEWKL